MEERKTKDSMRIDRVKRQSLTFDPYGQRNIG
jgi:hypothetical protein